jgi:hypothetical protein
MMTFQVPDALSPLSSKVPSIVHGSPTMLISILKFRLEIGQPGSLLELTLPDRPFQFEKFNVILVIEVLAAFTIKSNEPKAKVIFLKLRIE